MKCHCLYYCYHDYKQGYSNNKRKSFIRITFQQRPVVNTIPILNIKTYIIYIAANSGFIFNKTIFYTLYIFIKIATLDSL